MKIYAGLDCGGTKTHCVLVDEIGNIIGSGFGGPSNYLFCGRDEARKNIKKCISNAFKNATITEVSLETVFVGSAAIKLGCGSTHIDFFSTCINANNIICDSDLRQIWFGAARDNPAIISIAGTGAITCYCSKELYIKTSGWGPLLGDEGSGYYIGHKSVQMTMKILDGRVGNQEFMEEICNHYGVYTAQDMLRYFAKGDIRSEIASCTIPVCNLYKKNNLLAKEIIENAAYEIALSIITTIKKAKLAVKLPVIMSGSLLQKTSPLYNLVSAHLMKNEAGISEIIIPNIDPGVASAALALYYDGRDEACNLLLKI